MTPTPYRSFARRGSPELRILSGVAAACAVLLPTAATACPACYGSSSGPVIDGMNLAVVVMIGITGGVFSWIVAIAMRLARRERTADAPPGAGASTDLPGGEQ